MLLCALVVAISVQCSSWFTLHSATTQQTRDFDPMWNSCWASIAHGHGWANVKATLGQRLVLAELMR